MSKHESSHSMSESYILRIYRRNADDPQELVGTIEEVVEGRKQNFSTPQSLLDWLLQSDRKRNEK